MNSLKECIKCMFCVCCCEKWCERRITEVKDKIQRNAQSLYFFIFNVVILTFDVGSDILTAWKFWKKGQTKGPASARFKTYSILTMMFTSLPFLVSLFTASISFTRRNEEELMEQEKKLKDHIHKVSHSVGESIHFYMHR